VLTLTLFAYIAAAFLPNRIGASALGDSNPTIHVDHLYLMTLVAILGTTISPYLFFLAAQFRRSRRNEHGA